MYIFVDPGEHTGWAMFDVDGNEVDVFTTDSFEKTCAIIFQYINNKLPIKRVIVENFKLYPWKSQVQMWSEFETVQVIGAIRARCLEYNIPYETVPAHNKGMGFMYMGIKEPSHNNPANHQLVAMAHGVFWLQKCGIRTPQQGRQR
jgi:hypothetical protein